MPKYFLTLHIGIHAFPSRDPIECADRNDLEEIVRKYVVNWRSQLGPSSPFFSRPVEINVYDIRHRVVMTSHM